MSELTKKQLQRKASYLKNKEHWLALSKQRYLENKEYLLEYQRLYRKTNRVALTQRDQNKRTTRLEDAILLLGGKCLDCSRVFPSCVYDFHHIDPKEKEFTIGENMLVGKDRFYNEINKCVLLCANCHRLRHKEKN